ncbi:MAG: sigma-54-dependent Fis family transcriptional regulator, partial [Deltaproteobacteria bacterium]
MTAGEVLVIDDDRDLCALLALRIQQAGFRVSWRTSAAEALEFLDSHDVDTILTDVAMPGMDGLELCERIVAGRPDVPVVILTGAGRLETAIAAIRAGAYDFITKPPDMNALAVALGRAVEHRRLRGEVKRLRRAVEQAQGFGELIGTSPPMQRLYGVLG